MQMGFCEPYDLQASEDEWVVSWTLVDDEWRLKIYAFFE